MLCDDFLNVRCVKVTAIVVAAGVLGASCVPAVAGERGSSAWTRQSAIPTHLNFAGVALASDTHGFAIGAAGLILETVDAGAHVDRSFHRYRRERLQQHLLS